MSLGPRVLRILTHINIGATLGIAACLIWSSIAVAFSPIAKNAAKSLQAQPVSSQKATQPCECSRHSHRVQALYGVLALADNGQLSELQP